MKKNDRKPNADKQISRRAGGNFNTARTQVSRQNPYKQYSGAQNKDSTGSSSRDTFDRFLLKIGDWLKNFTDFLAGLTVAKKTPAAESKRTNVLRDDNKNAARPAQTETVFDTKAKPSAAKPLEDGLLSEQRAQIAEWLNVTKFRPRLLAGVDEADVWKKIRQLNRMYDDALLAERARYDALLKHYREMPEAADSDERTYEYDDADESGYDEMPQESADAADDPCDEEEYEDSDEDEYSDNQ